MFLTHKMAKHTQTIRRQIADDCLSVFGHFVNLALKGLNRIHILKEKVPTVEKKPQRLVFPYLGNISLQARIKQQKFIKGVKYAVNYRVIFASKTVFPPPNSYIRYDLQVSVWII